MTGEEEGSGKWEVGDEGGGGWLTTEIEAAREGGWQRRGCSLCRSWQILPAGAGAGGGRRGRKGPAPSLWPGAMKSHRPS